MGRAAWLLVVAATASACSLLANYNGLSDEYGQDAGEAGEAGEAGDAGGDGLTAPYSGLACGSSACNPAEEVCCFAGGQGDDFATGTCGVGNCAGDDYAQCATATDCAHTSEPDDVCCYVLL